MSFTVLAKKKFKSLKIFFLKQPWVTALLGWYGLYEFINRGPYRARRITFLYLFTHRNKKLRIRLINELMSQPECEKIIKERKRITTSIDDLANYPDDTLGKNFYLHMRKNNIKLVVAQDAPISSDFQYIIHRLLITHDIYHTILNAPTTAYGEAMVAGFTYAQIPSYAPPLVHVAAGTLYYSLAGHGLIDRGNLGVMIGWLLGKSTKQLFSVDWDQYWQMPIDKVREILNIDIEKIEKTIREFYAEDKDFLHKIKNIPTSIEEHLNDGVCVAESHVIPVKINQSHYDICVKSYKPSNNKVRAIAILGRAMFTSGNYLGKSNSPSIAACLLQNGIQVLIPIADRDQQYPENFDHMISNVNHYISLAQSLQPNVPIFLVGHSLSGLSFLANLGLHPNKKVSGIVTLGAATWNKNQLESEKKLLKIRLNSISGVLRMLASVCRFVPARLLRYGDYDEHYQMLQQVTLDNITKGEWKSLNKKIDYYESLKNVDCPVLSVASRRDQYCPPSQVKLFHQHLRENPEYIIVDHLTHMDLAASEHAWETWQQIAGWINERV